MIPQLIKPSQSRRGKGWSVTYLDEGRHFGHPGENLYIKTQSGYYSRPAWHQYRQTPTLECEYHALVFCQLHNIRVPEIVWFRQCEDVTELVIKEVSNAVQLDEYLASGDTPQNKLEVVGRVAIEIGKLHRLGWSHGALGNQHLLVQPDGTVTIIDFEKARWRPLATARDLDRFWRRTECLDDDQTGRFIEVYENCSGRKCLPPR